jgi:hypothetical protein
MAIGNGARRSLALALAGGLVLTGGVRLGFAAEAAGPLTAAQDHQLMMDQLGVRALRQGPASDATAPVHANYDEAQANPYPDWPDPLVRDDGRKVTTAEDWQRLRRPQILEGFEREVLGRVPARTPRVTWSAQASETEFIGQPVTATRLVGHVDNSADPAIEVNIPMMLIKPVRAQRPAPVLIMFSFGAAAFPAPVAPSAEQIARINEDLKALLVEKDPSLAEVFRQRPAWQPVPTPPFFPPRRQPDDPLPQLIADGWAVAVIDPTTIQADNGAGLTRGIIGLVNHGQSRRPDQWGALRAWAWGASRALDYLETDPELDAKHVGIEGVSRYGKAALVTMAFDQRFYMVLVGSSGEGGAAPYRRNYGEAVENLAAVDEYHWMAGNFLKYAAADAAFGARTANDLPVDSGELIALCAPRLTFISYGSPEHGDASWLDQPGSFMATVQAGKVFRLLGAKDLGLGDDYRTAKAPPTGVGLLGGQLAWRQHDGGHTDWPNFKTFIAWADRQMGRPTKIAP